VDISAYANKAGSMETNNTRTEKKKQQHTLAYPNNNRIWTYSRHYTFVLMKGKTTIV